MSTDAWVNHATNSQLPRGSETLQRVPVRVHPRRFSSAAALLLAGALLLAPRTVVRAADAMNVSEELDVEYGYVGDARSRGAGMSGGAVNEHSADLRFVVSPQVTKDLLLRFGFEWQRFSFGVPANAPLPEVLQQVSAIVGLDYQIADEWLVRAEVQPGVYSDFLDVNWRDVDAPLFLGAVWLAAPDLQWILGLRLDVRSQYPALPAAGVRWRFADEWTLNFIFPKPRLEYDLNEKLQFYVGAGIESGTFRVGENFGTDHGQPKLDGKNVDFLEIRLGPGGAWKLRPNLTIEAEVGFMPYRMFDFFGPNIVYRSHDAPYGQITIHARF